MTIDPYHQFTIAAGMMFPTDMSPRAKQAPPDPADAPLAEKSLRAFVKLAWHVPEPATRFMGNWHLDAICEHLQAVSAGQIRRLIINLPPRHMKSLAVAVFWPAWEWTVCPQRRWLFASYGLQLSARDSLKCRRLIQSPWYRALWGNRYHLLEDNNTRLRYENDHAGHRIATSVGGAATGEGGDRIVVDDPHNIVHRESESRREETLTWWDETMSTRLNDPKTGAKVIIMQRIHEKDLSGHVLKQGGYEHLFLPAEFESARRCATVLRWSDPRSAENELLWPERIGLKEIADFKVRLGPGGFAGQFQQRPAPAGGALFRGEWFRYYRLAGAGEICKATGGQGDKVKEVGRTPPAENVAAGDARPTGDSPGASNTRAHLHGGGTTASAKADPTPAPASLAHASDSQALSDNERPTASAKADPTAAPGSLAHASDSQALSDNERPTASTKAEPTAAPASLAHASDSQALSDNERPTASAKADPTAAPASLAHASDSQSLSDNERPTASAKADLTKCQPTPRAPGDAAEPLASRYYLPAPGGVTTVVLAKECTRFAVMDPAASEPGQGRRPCYTVVQVWDVTPGGDMLLVHQYRKQVQAHAAADAAAKICRDFDVAYIAIEKDGIGLGVVQQVKREGIAVRPIKARGPKECRSQTAEIRMANGQVYFPAGADFLFELEKELLQFPHGEYADQVDALAHAAIQVQKLTRPFPQPVEAWQRQGEMAWDAEEEEF